MMYVQKVFYVVRRKISMDRTSWTNRNTEKGKCRKAGQIYRQLSFYRETRAAVPTFAGRNFAPLSNYSLLDSTLPILEIDPIPYNVIIKNKGII